MRNLVIDRIRELILESYIYMDQLDHLETMSNVDLLDLLEDLFVSEIDS